MSEPISQRTNHPTAFVIFGGTGDLARRKLLPALFDLFARGLLPERSRIIGLSRKTLTDEEYRAFAQEQLRERSVRHAPEVLAAFCEKLFYVPGNFTDTAAYEAVRTALDAFDHEIGQCTNKLFYLAVPPGNYGTIFTNLHESDLMSLCDGVDSWSRLLVEKPFGHDTDTAMALEGQLCELFNEDQIFRIDHYLAKDAIENIMSFRFANSVFSDSWNGASIESIHLLLAESDDVSKRGAFYDGVGALRDVGQNHLLQLLALLTMRNVDLHDVSAVRSARAEALRALSKQAPQESVRGQYEGYRDTDGVAPESTIETYFKINTTIEANGWQDVSVVLESGKALARSITRATILFRAEDECRCELQPEPHQHHNTLTMTFSPEQTISLSLWVKKPGFGFMLEERELELTTLPDGNARSPEAYERVLYDCIVGDQTRFVSGEEVRAEWEFITPIMRHFDELPLVSYAKGSLGPDATIN